MSKEYTKRMKKLQSDLRDLIEERSMLEVQMTVNEKKATEIHGEMVRIMIQGRV